jgi:hypothetical protein
MIAATILQRNAMGSPLHLTGAIYKVAPALKRAARPVGTWNTFRIEAQANHFAVRLNGALVSSLMADGRRPRHGYIGLQAHHAGSRVQFRNIRIHEY